MKYMIAKQVDGEEKYLHVAQGRDYYDKDTSDCLKYTTKKEVLMDIEEGEYIVKIDAEGVVTK